MKRASLAVVLALVAVGCGSSSTSPSTSPTNPTFTVAMLPSNEAPTPVSGPESVATGNAVITFIPTKDGSGNVTSVTATVVVNLANFPAGSTVTNSHIHPGAAGVAGSVLIPFPPPTVSFSNGPATYTATATPPPTVDQFNGFVANPAGFYFNVHTALNPGGVMRGQLVKQ